MERAFIDPRQVELGLRAVKAVAAADGVVDDRERRLLCAAARALRWGSETEPDVDALTDVGPEELAAAMPDPVARTRVVQAQILMAMMDGDVEKSELAVIRRFATALGVDEPRLHNLRQYIDHHYTLMKLDLNRRSRMTSEAVAKAWRDAGFRGAWKTLMPFISRFGRDEELAWRYRKLGLLPEHTFGRQYWVHMRERNFAFPGEEHGFPEPFIKHDCCHVLGGYDTDPPGECEVVAFICGFMRSDPFWYLFMITMHMHLGIETFQDNERGYMDFDPERVVRALERGSRVNRDLYDVEFDWWALFPRPIEDVRAELGIA